ncbi:MAG: DUF5106 domain-containing protein, partial [Bacteroidia bacterium]|nr:DUF5106 domain-containing protein [Bacteroidia bacterium]
MNSLRLFFLSTLIALFSINAYSQNGGYNLSFTIEGLNNVECYLANYYGNKQYLKDTAQTNAKGEFTFKSKEALGGGIYLVVMPGQKYFEIVVDADQEFHMQCDTLDYVKSMKVSGSEDNELFYGYLKYISTKQEEVKQYSTALEDDPDNKKAKEGVERIDNEVKTYKRDFMQKHASSFVSSIFKASQDPEIPDAPTLENGKKDSTFAFRYYRAHFWDEIDLNDDRLLRTPIYHTKMEQYITKLTVQIPDSINAAADFLVSKVTSNEELFKYTVWWITNHYETSKIMGMDAVFVHMVENYYTKEKAFWVDETTLFKIRDRAKVLKPILLGKVCPNIVLTDSTGEYHSLHNVKKEYTIVYFWDPDCSHCKTVTPILKDVYGRNRADIEVFAVCVEIEIDKWKKYIKENELDWINVADPNLRNNFRHDFDISTTPQIFVLDKDKKIIAKRLDVEQVE